MDPVKTMPYYAHPIWSGNDLNKKWNKDAFEPIGESWEFSVIPDKSCCAEGRFDGIPFDTLLKAFPEWTPNGAHLLFKLISTADDLSVQVHPDDEYAMTHEHSLGKTESWYILDAEKDAVIYLGLKKDIDLTTLENSLKNGTVLDLLNKIKVKKDEYYYIPAGTIHALGKGVTVAEIQQSSNVTYRLYDYNRLQNGKPRELHIEKALDVCSLKAFDPTPLCPDTPYDKITLLKECNYFTSSVLALSENSDIFSYHAADYAIMTMLSGSGTIFADTRTYRFMKGDTYFLPAGCEIHIASDCTDGAKIYINTPYSER